MKTQDRGQIPQQNFRRLAKPQQAERVYARQLKRLARHVGHIIGGFDTARPEAIPTLTQMLRAYADALMPWAAATAAKMVEDVNRRDLAGWKTISAEMSAAMQKEIQTAPVGETLRRLMAEQVDLIRSIPLDAAQRVHDLTIKGLENGTRAKEIAAEIMRSGEVAQSRATLIARTEVARTASSLTQARAQAIGSEGYVWKTSNDSTVRESHRKMQGKLVMWDAPPTLDGMTGHAGRFPNCRCWASPILSE